MAPRSCSWGCRSTRKTRQRTDAHLQRRIRPSLHGICLELCPPRRWTLHLLGCIPTLPLSVPSCPTPVKFADRAAVRTSSTAGFAGHPARKMRSSQGRVGQASSVVHLVILLYICYRVCGKRQVHGEVSNLSFCFVGALYNTATVAYTAGDGA
ncbi:hypothetical protein U9M48_037306 [Paspalum notatum var. saurae]|uniref:Uncharacterized protein n=1 Tax=Paspalum notatum var. saurae TaxID=547442 RepID=A0AAQ3XAX8_PASNO